MATGRFAAGQQTEAAVTIFGGELEAHVASLRRYARTLLRRGADADDLVQETLTRALAGAASFTMGTNLRAWLFTILHNTYVNQVRRQASRPEEELPEALELRLSEPATQESRLELRDMSRALDTLPAEQRQVLLLVALEGLKYEEVAATLGIPVGTVMSRLSRGREAVRRALGDGPATGGLRLRRVK
ncbi:ECF RNA polymerase sigma factor EcfG [uncultured Gammaproteobacteria bacterium]